VLFIDVKINLVVLGVNFKKQTGCPLFGNVDYIDKVHFFSPSTEEAIENYVHQKEKNGSKEPIRIDPREFFFSLVPPKRTAFYREKETQASFFYFSLLGDLDLVVHIYMFVIRTCLGLEKKE